MKTFISLILLVIFSSCQKNDIQLSNCGIITEVSGTGLPNCSGPYVGYYDTTTYVFTAGAGDTYFRVKIKNEISGNEKYFFFRSISPEWNSILDPVYTYDSNGEFVVNVTHSGIGKTYCVYNEYTNEEIYW
jgi:hypothetical protein